VTVLELSLCGNCHKDEYQSFFQVDYEAQARKEKGVPTGRSPMMDKLLAPYGFTFEHNEPRGHAFMVTDQFVVDRFAGGRFQYKKRWWSVDATGKTWDILEDTGKTLPESAKAGNPTCIQCKTSDHILKWKFMGEKDPKAVWNRTSDPIAVARDTQNPMGCIHCHDPHGAKPRIVRDALIKEVVINGSKMFAEKQQNRTAGTRFPRFQENRYHEENRFALDVCPVPCGIRLRSRLRIRYREKDSYDDPDQPRLLPDRKNSWPLQKLNFYDFRHAVTGARLVKLQHPEAETYAGSVHDRNGITCSDCHMPRMKTKTGKTFRTHGVIRPKNHVKEACLRCHPDSTVQKKLYQIDAIQNYIKGKMRKSEYWLGQLIDTYAIAKRWGVDEATLAKAREKHEEAHVLWEWWTAENSDGFHNPDLARETLTGSIALSKEGVALLNKAIESAKQPAKK
jgi:formate-dependent nitrite reductase cytochrome c552 subunit